MGAQPPHGPLEVVQLLREHRVRGQAIVNRNHGHAVGSERGQPHGTVSAFVASGPPTAVHVHGDLRPGERRDRLTGGAIATGAVLSSAYPSATPHTITWSSGIVMCVRSTG